MSITDFASLLGPLAIGDFERHFLEKRRLVVTATDRERASAVLPRWILDRLVTSDFLPERRLEVLREGDVLPRSAYRGDDGRVRASALETLAREGVSFVVNGIDDDVPAIARIADSIERRLGHDVWVNAYVTHGSGGALAPHYDDHDVIVLQLEGRKRWFGHGSPVESPIESSPDGVDFGPPTWDVLVEPADVLYLPRGEVHHTSVEGTHAIHLTFGIDTRRGVDLLRSLVDRAALDEAFRRDVTRLGGPRASGLRVSSLRERMHALVDAIDVETFLRDDDAARPLRASPHRGASSVDGASAIVPLVRRRIALPAGIDEMEPTDSIEVRAGGTSFRLSVIAARALSTLLDRDGATVAELTTHLGGGASTDDAIHAVNELSRNGLVAPGFD